MLKITALQPIRIYANVVSFENIHIGQNHHGRKVKNHTGYIQMAKGESRADISLFIGIDSRYLPSEQPIEIDSEVVIVPYKQENLSPAFRALVQVDEVST